MTDVAHALPTGKTGKVGAAAAAAARGPAAAEPVDGVFSAMMDELLRFDGERDNPFAFSSPSVEKGASSIVTIGQFMVLHRPEADVPGTRVPAPRRWSDYEDLLSALDREVIFDGALLRRH